MKKTNQNILLIALVWCLLSLSNHPIFAAIGNKMSEVETVKVLTIGNSFADNACRFLKEIAGSVQGCEIIIGKANLGGHSLEQHASYIKQSEENPNFKAYSNGTKSLKDLLQEREWDVVTIQQVSTLSFKPESFQPYADEIVEHIKKYSPNSQIHIHQTWAYAPDAPRLHNLGITYEEMYNKLTANYLQLSQRYDDTPILRSGDAFYNSYKKNNEIDLWHETDRFHANNEGCYLGGCVWFSRLFKKDPAIITFIPDGMSQETAKHLKDVARSVSGYDSISVQAVFINCPSSELALGVKHQLKATVLPSDATDKRVSWTSSNPSVATIDSTGLLTALAEGTTKIKVITNNGELADSCTIAVKTDINILFIGNSFTFRHDLNLLVEEVFKEGSPNLNIYTERQVHGGQSLFQHTEYYFTQSFIEQSTLTNSEIEERIQIMKDFLLLDEAPPEFIHFWENVVGQAVKDFPKNVIENAIKRHEDLLKNNPRTKWDYVVLQSWQDEIDDMDDGYAKYAKILGNIAKEQGAEVILYITAPDIQNQAPVSVPVNQKNVEQEISTIVNLAREINPYAVVHVPLAINMIQQDGTNLTFRYVNDFHPNQRTAYLTSNMFYAAFFNESTEGFNYDTVTETKTTSSGGKLLDPDGGPATVVFEGDEKTYLQKIAFNATSMFNELWKSIVSVTGVSIENKPVDGIPFGTSFQLNKKILPLNASDQRVSWSSSDTKIATVDSTGLVSAMDIGSVTITVKTNDGGFTDSFTFLVTSQAIQRPYLGIKQLIPGIVECEFYDEGGQGISFYDVDLKRLTTFRDPDEVDIRWRTQASRSRFVGLTAEGEWLEYTVDVTPGDYDIMLYYFCQMNNSTKIELSLDGNKIGTFTGMTNKGNLDIQDSVFVRGVSLAGGNNQILRLEFAVGGDVEVDAIVFTPASNSQTNSLSIEMESDMVKIYPNPVQDVLYISFKKPQSETIIYIYNTLGALLYSKKVDTSLFKFDVKKFNKEPMLFVQTVSNEFTTLNKVILTE